MKGIEMPYCGAGLLQINAYVRQYLFKRSRYIPFITMLIGADTGGYV
jgi:hypothetical protein